MDEKVAMTQMAARLVQAMEPQEAKDKLLEFVCSEGGDLFEIILKTGTDPVPVPRKRKAGGGRRKKALGPQGQLVTIPENE